MVKFGFALSSEEHGPGALARLAAEAEKTGFSFSLISDHFHPWVSAQPHSPFVWSTLGAISQTTEKLVVGTGVTCPIQRIHPAIIAQAAATTGSLLEGRFFLGLGTGENLNEHIFGDRWPPTPIRLEMLDEAVRVIRSLWQGKMTTHYGEYFTVEDARIFTLPETLPPISLAASGPEAAELAGRIGDSLISVVPKKEIVEAFRQGGGEGKPCYGQVTLCYDESEEKAAQTALEWWPNSALPSPLNVELRSVEHFDQAAESVTLEQVRKSLPCGPDVSKHREAIEKFIEAGYDHIYIHQVGPEQKAFMKFFRENFLEKPVAARK
jgi:coenzyme F420-dependent glucose-6-phosphate dehydrogenase